MTKAERREIIHEAKYMLTDAVCWLNLCTDEGIKKAIDRTRQAENQLHKIKPMNKITSLIGAVLLLAAVTSRAQSISNALSNAVSHVTTNAQQETAVDNALNALDLGITNISVDPYATYAPNAPAGSSKFGGGLFTSYNFNNYAGAGIGLDWLGQFSLVSGDLSLQAPFHLSTLLPAVSKISLLENVEIVPFTIIGVATPYSGNGKFNGSPMAVSDFGAYLTFGHLWQGQFNAGAAWGKWVGQGPYGNVTRYHLFFGYMKQF
jgi:hypothetical protein